MTFKNTFLHLTLSSTLMLSACGGGSSQSDNTNNVDTIGSILQLEDSLSINQGVDLILYFPDGDLTNIQWQQTAGDAVDLLAPKSKAIGFTPASAGEYSFSVSFNNDGGASQTLTKTITVTGESSLITTRLAHEVRSGNKVSLRAEINEDIDSNLLNWEQVAGPTVTLTDSDTNGKLAIFFDAPQVNKDTYLSFTASISSDGVKYSDTVTILVESADTISNNAYFETRVAKVFSYNESSPYKDDLVDCVYSNALTSSCTLNKLPLIASEVQNAADIPSVDTIMDRVVVSHQWMGEKFKSFLINNDPHDDIKRLLRATTAIVISYDVRPSFYWAATGAIYLDANNFWLTAQERDTINEAPDYRADFGNDLQFVMPWRYVKDNDYAYSTIPSSVRTDRTENDGLYRLTSLMYHELAHANDFFPSSRWSTYSSSQRILDAAVSNNTESDNLSVAYPLQSQTMRDLAQVSFAGESATNTQKSYLPTDIEIIFSTDSATDFYAYSSLREDYAMLFEELMMQKRFNIFRDVAITNQPIGDTISSSDYKVTWGQRGRIGEQDIKPRVLFSASRVLPEFDSETALLNVPTPIQMTSGNDWIENLTIGPIQSNNLKNAKRVFTTKQDQQAIPYLYHHKPLPKH
ncbi:hypothetical protein Q4503_12075 [Colwellia sp. 6_MG-2023]|uniref:hypothetical protein n=1 Tax=Colwellia sp. 6_MG-2023 TaxID=3062676 RepID=UPI0026E19DE1|nr:hypothetical protein [Colwellia sp. 6_MG-2023]MDO6488443.1 hypothetical protein [Colwellia sp. 6_MG-2023]